MPTGPASEDVDDDDVPGRCYLRVWSRKMESEPRYLGNFGSCGRQFLAFHPKILVPATEALPGVWGAGRWCLGSHVAHLNFKMSCVSVFKCFMSLSEIE